MLASESLGTARLLDKAEVRLRGLARKAKALWKKSPAGVKVLIVAAFAGGAVAAAYAGYRLFFGS
jgi:hypothetical protein